MIPLHTFLPIAKLSGNNSSGRNAYVELGKGTNRYTLFCLYPEGDVEDDEGESCIDYSCWGVMMKDGSYVIVDTCCDRDAALGMCEG